MCVCLSVSTNKQIIILTTTPRLLFLTLTLPYILVLIHAPHLGPLPSTACSSTRTCPLPIPSPSDWPRLLLSQTFTCINTLAILFWLFFLFERPMKMGKGVPKCQHIKFTCQGITQKKEYNIHNSMKV